MLKLSETPAVHEPLCAVADLALATQSAMKAAPMLTPPDPSSKALAVAENEEQHDHHDGVTDTHGCDTSSETSDFSAWTRSSTGQVSLPDISESAARFRGLISREKLIPDFLATVQCDGRGGVTEAGRRALVIWMREFNLFLGLSPGTFAVAVALVDSMLQRTRVKPEHADLVGVACLRIAASQMEPADLQPTLRELSRDFDSEYDKLDIERMEALVRKKLSGDMQFLVPLDFLDEITVYAVAAGVPHALVATAAFESQTTNVILSCLSHYEMLSFRPSTLALSVFAAELGRLQPAGSDFSLQVIDQLQEIAGIPDWDLDACSRCVLRCLKTKLHSW